MSALSIFSTAWLNKLASIFGQSYYTSRQAAVTGSTTVGNFTDAGLELTLPAGTYDIESNCAIYMAGGTGSVVQGRYAIIRLTDSSNNVVQDIFGRNVNALGGFANAASPTTVTTIMLKARVTIAAGTYKIRFTSRNNSGAESLSDLILYASAADGLATLKATKVII